MEDSLSLVPFLIREYLEGYIKTGGSKVKLFMDKDGTKVTRVLQALCSAAAEHNYAVSYLDASKVAKVNIFSNVYQAALRELDLVTLVESYCYRVVQSLGYEASEIPEEADFVSWACLTHGRVPERLRNQVQEQLEKDLFRNRLVNRSFAIAILQLAADFLGAREKRLTEEDKTLLYTWLRGEEVLLRELRRFHVFVKVDRYNARSMFRSLIELVCLTGKTGLLLALDKLEVLLAKKEGGRLLYSRAARDEFFESIRQLIDGIETLSHLMIILGFQRALADDEQKGIHSYEALWLRIQHEVKGSKTNLFRDFLDLDEVATGVSGAEGSPEGKGADLAEI